MNQIPTLAAVAAFASAAAFSDALRFSAPASPRDLAAALERRIVSGEGVVLPDADVPIVLDVGTVDLSQGDWPEEFSSAAGNFAFVSISPDTGNYEFSDTSGAVFWTLCPVVPLVGNWVAPFRRSTDVPSSVDPLFDPSRVVLRFFPSLNRCTVEPLNRSVGVMQFGTSMERHSSETASLRFSAFEIGDTNGAIRVEADWPEEGPPPDATLDLYHAPQVDAATGLCTNKIYADGSAVTYTFTPIFCLSARRSHLVIGRNPHIIPGVIALASFPTIRSPPPHSNSTFSAAKPRSPTPFLLPLYPATRAETS